MKKTSVLSTILGLAFLLVLQLFAVSGAHAQGKGKGRQGQDADHDGLAFSASLEIGISVGDAKRLAAASGQTGRRALPPGIARNLARGKPLPPGIAKQAVPPAMLAGLPAIEGHEWVIAGEDLLLVTLGTAIVVTILDEVFF